MEFCVIRTNRNTLSLQIDDNGEIIVRAPVYASDKAVNQFVEEKTQWIVNKLSHRNNVIQANKYLFDLKQVLIVGQLFDIEYVHIEKIQLTPTHLLIPFKLTNDAEKIKTSIKKFIKQEANKYIPQMISSIGTMQGQCPSSITISNSKGKWGSCNNLRKISINYQVIQLPRNLIEYIIVHEICHLSVLNHSKQFWELVQKYYPNYMAARTQLKQYNYLLKLYD